MAKNNKAATEEMLGELHHLLASSMKAQLAEFQRQIDNGEMPEIPPAFMAQVIKFLKDNGIDQPRKEGNDIDKLANMLPELTAVDEHGIHH